MATIEKRANGAYRIVVSAGYDVKGKKIRHYETITADELSGLTERQINKELERRKVLFEQRVKNGQFMEGEKITLGEFSLKWLEDYAMKELAPSTIHVYKTRIEKRIIPAMGHIKLAKLQPHHLIEFYDNLGQKGIRLDIYYQPTEDFKNFLIASDKKGLAAEIGISRLTLRNILNGKFTNEDSAKKICDYFNLPINNAFAVISKAERLSSNTVAHHHRLLSSMLSTAVQWQIIDSNPALKVKPPSVKKKKIQSYDDAQVLQLFQALENAPLNYKTMIYLVMYTGMRLSELSGLVWENVDFEKKCITIDRERMYISDFGIIEKDTKTDAGIRVITIPSVVIKLLKEYHKECLKKKMILGKSWQGLEPGTGYIFLNDVGLPIFPSTPSKWFNEFLQKNKLPKIVFHGLRHSHASILIAEGVDIVTVSERLGHSNKSITLNTYSHSIKSKDQAAVDKLENLLTRKNQ